MFLEQQADGLASGRNRSTRSARRSCPTCAATPSSGPITKAMGYQRWHMEHMFVIAPAAAYVGHWLQSFREFPPRQKPGSFNLEQVMEAVTAPLN